MNMDSISILDELLGVLAAQGVSIRKTAMGGDGGGVCMVRGAAKALRSVIDVEKIFLKPQLRMFIEQYGSD